MKKIVFILALFMVSCADKELVSVEVKNLRSSTVLLFEGKYIVHFHFTSKADLEVDFPISEDEIRCVKKAYVKHNIRVFKPETLVVNEEIYIVPTFDTTYILKFSDGSEQIFVVRDDHAVHPLEQEKYRQLKIFLETIDAIIKSKPEIKNAEKSDAFYI